MKFFLQTLSVILFMIAVVTVNSAIQSPVGVMPFVAGACVTVFIESFRFYCRQD